MKKHHPDPDSWLLAQLVKHNPEALRRMEEANQREMQYLRTKGAL